jgi:hypothetical protein
MTFRELHTVAWLGTFGRAMRGSALWVGLLVAIVVAVFVANRPIAPVGADAPAEAFSEGRVRPLLKHLTDDIGVRRNGSPGAAQAATDLAARLREIPGVEVDVQRVSETRLFRGTFLPWPVMKYHVTNVVARFPGRVRDAILLDAHYDTIGDSPGAGDDGVGIAAIVETARALAAGPRLERSVIILCNGGEEYGLYGADGFIRRHPLAADVRAYLYVDGSPRGPAVLLYSGPGTPSLVEAYARAAPHPLASSIAVDLIESNLLSHDGDHRPFRDQGVPGLAFAPIGDLWSPHTKLDRFDRLEPGTIQHAGETVLAITRRLASTGELPKAIEPERTVYFDVFGLFVVRYRALTGAILGSLTVLVALGAVLLLWRRKLLDGRGFLLAFSASLVGGVAALVAPIVVGSVLAFVIRRPHGWYTAPWIVAFAFVAPSVAALLGVHQAFAKRIASGGRDPIWAAWAAAIAGWCPPLVAASLAHARSGYVPLVWTAASSIGLLAAMRWPAWRMAIALAATLPGFYVIAQLGPMLSALCAQMGLQPLPIPADPLIALLCGSLTVAAGAAIVIPSLASQGAGRAAWAFAALGGFGIVVSAMHAPFSPERPRRILVTHGEENGQSAFFLRARDGLPLEPALEGLPEARPASPSWTKFEIFEPAPTHELPGPPPAFGRPRVEVVSSTRHADGTRTVVLRLGSDTSDLRLFFAAGRVVRWSVQDEVPANPVAGGRAVIYLDGFPPEGDTISVTLRGAEPAEVQAISSSFLPTDAIAAIGARLPAWALPLPLSARAIRVQI